MRKTAKIHTAFAILTALALNIAPVRASEDHLPKKAKAVAEKWVAFEKTAKPADRESKRVEVIRYLGGLLKAEASKANLDGALAVKALMEKLEAPKPTVKAVAPTSAADEGLPTERFSINTEAKRRLEFPFNVADDRALKTIHCKIEGAGDDTGDLGLEYELVDPKGKVAKRGKLNSHSVEPISHETHNGGAWKIVIIDTDTTFADPHPGNNGTVSVTIKRTPTVADAR